MITEPSTLITDLLLAAVAGTLAVRLWRLSRPGDRAARLWSGGLVVLAVAAATGGLYHGFRTVLGPGLAAATWKVTVLSIGIADLLLAAGALLAWTGGALRQALLGLVAVKFLLYAGWMARHDDFTYVLLEYAPSLVLLALLSLWGSCSQPGRGGSWVLAGVLVSAVAAVVLALGVSFHPHFNQNDLYHLIQIVAVWLLYRGGRSWCSESDPRPEVGSPVSPKLTG